MNVLVGTHKINCFFGEKGVFFLLNFICFVNYVILQLKVINKQLSKLLTVVNKKMYICLLILMSCVLV